MTTDFGMLLQIIQRTFEYVFVFVIHTDPTIKDTRGNFLFP